MYFWDKFADFFEGSVNTISKKGIDIIDSTCFPELSTNFFEYTIFSEKLYIQRKFVNDKKPYLPSTANLAGKTGGVPVSAVTGTTPTAW